jgi:hypothetical protein
LKPASRHRREKRVPSSSYSSSPAMQHSGKSIGSPRFSFPEEIPIDKVSTLDQLTTQFAGVKDGLPELVKNSKDQYSRLHILEECDRQIVVLLSTGLRRLAVLDFAGAPLSNFEGWTVWSDPTAGKAEQAADIEAGHGNGGKAFMVRGATEFSFMESCYQGRRTRKGFRNSLPAERYKPGYALESSQQIAAIPEIDPRWRLERFLAEVGVGLDDLPAEALAAFERRDSYTGVLLSKVADWTRKRRGAIVKLAQDAVPEIITTHGQTALTIETCQVWVVVDGSIVNDGHPLKPIPLDPYPGFEEPMVFDIPDILPDPEGFEAVDTAVGPSGERKLILRTSSKHLRLNSDTRARNVIRVRNNRNNVATWPLPSLGILPASIGFVYGELRCPALLDEHLAGADRLHLANTSLARALRHWTTGLVRNLAEALHQTMLSEAKPQERQQARTALSGIRELMREYLEADADGRAHNDGDYGSQGADAKGIKRHRVGTQYGERIDQIELENSISDLIVVQGTTIPLSFRCLELSPDRVRPVRGEGLKLLNSADFNWQMDSRGNLTPHEIGIAEVWLETPDGSVSSNRVEIWVAHANGIEANMPVEPLKQGQSVAIPFVFQTDEGPLQDTVIEAQVLELGRGTIGRKGRFQAGTEEGSATIRVRYGAGETAYRDFQIWIGSEKMPDPVGKAGSGSDVPFILFCGDDAPNREDLPAEQRTLSGGPEYPTIIEDPLFPSVVWINDSSKEAVRVRKSKGGSSGVGKITSRNFFHFIALKCFDILKRLYVRQRIAGGRVTEYQYILYAMEAEMECAAFVDAAWELSEELLHGGDQASV